MCIFLLTPIKKLFNYVVLESKSAPYTKSPGVFKNFRLPLGTLQSSALDPWVTANYKTYSSSRWNTMIYEVSNERALAECALFCYSQEDKKCQFFLHSGTDCNLGSFSSTDSASSTSGHLSIYINYGKKTVS